ncbi:Divalent metal cation (Fe/Co/Zn/Cd) transporter [Butyrivibrio fibrisolvens DSM 3071]|uniref:Divalent metal cation (Fe/Co/Zn/Cd) transporter n=1 Tax=Butyrivibrio fibrisolvens DSM 3071 TaxID=1121131 RepID=A0A1M6CQ31_BUTFI|nr:cation transporter [Butyrivibrio fibrisolvens]SHI62993.1 Divalent metal cation (Fe/Co/Zn/Cd) transporter [Butyrivibrio fibrisolvens DSM 3071]
MDHDSKKTELRNQQRIALLLILWRLPEFFTSFIAASASGSVVVWLEFIENASILIPGIILLVLSGKLSRNLKYVFNYGTGKVEAITALCCEIFDITGLFCVSFFAIKGLFAPEEDEKYLGLALAVSIAGLFIDLIILRQQKKILSGSHSKMFHTALVSAQKEFFFDAASIITLVISLVFEGTLWIRYFSPVVCLIIVVPFFTIVMKHLRESVSELVDRTLDEESQLKIIKVLNEFYDSYEEFGEVRSRINGEEKYIDIELTFKADMKYQDVKTAAAKIEERIREELGDCHINVVI